MVSGLPLLRAFGYFDPRSSWWRMWPPSGREGLAEFSATWPRLGTVQRGSACAPRTSEQRIVARGSSPWPTTVPPLPSWPLLPTPTAHDSHSGQVTTKRLTKGHQVGLNDLAVTLFPLPRPGEEPRLLPTPTARDSTGAQPLGKRQNRARLNDVTVALFPLPKVGGTEKLLPTPRASDGMKGSPNQRGSRGDLTLPSAVIQLTKRPKPHQPRTRRQKPP